MRKVLFQVFIPMQNQKVEGKATLQLVPGTGVMGEYQEGVFHQWGLKAEQFHEGACSETVGLIEDATGQMHVVEPDNFKFQEPLLATFTS